MKTTPFPSCARFGRIVLLLVFEFLCAAAHAADTGVIIGRVSNATTGAYLEGAEVSIVGQTAIAFTARDGSFTLSAPSGAHTVRVYYTGLELATKPVSVSAGQTAEVAVALSSDVQVMETFTVAAEREGNAASLTKQRNADNVVNVVSMDSFGNVADGNIGNFLQNLPGITTNRDWGDIVGVGVRGLPPHLNSVSVDGARSASSSAGFSLLGDRAVLIDQIPSEFIKEVEVTKGNTPDQWADSLGGSINLVTKSAFDYKSRVVTYRVAGNLNTYRRGNPWEPTAALTYLDSFGANRKFGLALSPTSTTTLNTLDRVQMERQNADNRMSSARDFADTAIRLRSGIGSKFEYRPDASLRFSFDANLINYKMTRDRRIFQSSAPGSGRVADYARVSRAAIEAGTAPRDSANATAGIAPGFTDTFTEMLNAGFTNTAERLTDHSRQLKLGVGGKKTWESSSLSFKASYNPTAFEQDVERIVATLVGGIGMSVDTSKDPERPVFRQTYGPTVLYGSDLSRYTGRRTHLSPDTEEEIGEGTIDYEKKFTTASWALQLKSGLGFRTQHRRSQAYSPQWDLLGVDGVAGRNAATGLNDDNLAQFRNTEPAYANFNGFYQAGDQLDVARVKNLFRDNPAYFRAVGTTVAIKPPPGEITEEVSAGYLMARGSMGRFSAVAGARSEHTAVAASGSESDPLNPTQTTIKRQGDYERLFPSVHLRYQVAPKFLLRASWSTSSARPRISDLIPNTSVSYDSGGHGTVRSNNPGLKPQSTSNYDLSAEHYFDPAGVISVGVFHKDVKNFITSVTTKISEGTNNGFGGNYASFDLTTNSNIGSATVRGLELNVTQQLVMLPKPLNGLSVWANYTKIEATGIFSSGDTELEGFIPETYNAGLSFKWRGFRMRTAYHYTSSYLNSFSTDAVSKRYLGENETVDGHLEYAWKPGLTVFADWTNIFNQSPPFYSFRVDPNRIRIVDNFGGRLSVGFSGRF